MSTTQIPRTLFVEHTGKMGGAEFVLLDLVSDWTETSAVWLLQDGPFRDKLREAGVETLGPPRGVDLENIKRDKSLFHAAPHLGRLAASSLRLAAASREFDLLYANSQKAFILSAVASVLARRTLVWHLHDILTEEHFGRAQIRLVVRLANSLAALVLVPSTQARDAFLAAGGHDSLVHVVPNGVDLPPETRERKVLRADLGVPDGFVFGVFSRLARWKGQHIALQALEALPDAKAVIAGDALFGESDYVAELRTMAQRPSLAGRVLFLGHREDVPLLMRAVDVVVHPSVAAEPFGRTLVEAMLCGTPVIATNAGAAPDILDHGASGLLVPPGDSAALANALRLTTTDAYETSRRVSNGWERARSEYAVARARSMIASLLSKLPAHRPLPR